MTRPKITFFSVILISAISALSVFQGDPLPKSPQYQHQLYQKEGLSGACRHCHDGGEALRQDLSQPECQECHGEPSIPDGPLPVGMSEEIPVIEQKLIHIPAGSFLMGSPGRPAAEGRGNEDEGPPHEVFVKSYYIDLYETTNAHYQEYIEATGVKPPLLWRKGIFPVALSNHPVVYVSWHDADAFCRWAGKRLPKEAEWEKAGRGDDGRHFPWGVQFDARRANTPQYSLSKGLKVSKGGTMPVGSFEEGRSPYGLYDMSGNVYEWVDNWYLPYPGNQVSNIHYGRRNKVLRGGSWYDCMSYGCGLSSPLYNRSRFTPEIKNKGFGFRCASDHPLPLKSRKNPLQEKTS